MSALPDYDLDAAALDIFDLMRRQPGDVFSREGLASELGYSAEEVDAGVKQLIQFGFVNQTQAGGATAYALSPSAPEL